MASQHANQGGESAITRVLKCLLVLTLTFAMVACGTSRREQLHRVAKDWSETIRASQVIPVYPMTEDLQPGDVYLVQLPISQQQMLWKRSGFLPLDNHFHRLHPEGYSEFYKSSFLDCGTQAKAIPRAWRNSPDGPWTNAPGAAFPSYSFTVRRGVGVNAAAPISGVPIGLSLLGTQSATASVVIKDARTYGVDIVSLYKQLEAWADQNAGLLAPYAPEEGRPPRSYLRVVTRVYLTGEIDITLQDTRSGLFGVDAGATRPVDLLFIEPGTDNSGITMKKYQENLARMNRDLAEAKAMRILNGIPTLVPGGSLRVVAASARSVSLSETFNPPLSLGYLGFDVEIRTGGQIGPPVPTYAILTGAVSAVGNIGDRLTGELSRYADLYDAAAARSDSDQIFLEAAISLGESWAALYRQIREADSTIMPQDAFGDLYEAYLSYAHGATREARRRQLIDSLAAAFTRQDKGKESPNNGERANDFEEIQEDEEALHGDIP